MYRPSGIDSPLSAYYGMKYNSCICKFFYPSQTERPKESLDLFEGVFDLVWQDEYASRITNMKMQHIEIEVLISTKGQNQNPKSLLLTMVTRH